RTDRPRLGHRQVHQRDRERRGRCDPQPDRRAGRVDCPHGGASSPPPLHRPARPACRLAGHGRLMTARTGQATPVPPAAAQENLQGRYAGFASRFLAFAADVVVLPAGFLLILAAVNFVASFATGKTVNFTRSDIWVVIAYVVWAFVYFSYWWGLNGKTPGGGL